MPESRSLTNVAAPNLPAYRWEWVLTAAGLLLVATARPAETGSHIDCIDFYGSQQLSPQALRTALGVKEGDPTPMDGGAESERALEKLPGVVKARVKYVSYEQGKTTVFAGIQEQPRAGFVYNSAPDGTASLPPEIMQLYDRFSDALAAAVKRGDLQEDDSQGHATYSSKALQPFQNEFIGLANSKASLLKNVLKNSANAGERAAAACVLGYAGDKREVLDDLMRAVRDPDEGVRNNATRTVGTIAVLAERKPGLGITIEPAVFIQMLNSLTWTDRNKATMVLLNLSKGRAPDLLDKMRRAALPALIEMARWKDRHSLMALRLVGRIAGLSDTETDTAWKNGKPEGVISRALGPQARQPSPTP